MKWKNWTERTVLDKLLLISEKSIRTFSNTEHCFGDRIVNFSPIVLIFFGQAPLWPLWGMKWKKLDWANYFGQVFNYFQKVSALDES